MTESQAEKKYSGLEASEFRNLILRKDEESDLAAFYLLSHILIAKIIAIYKTVEVKEDLDDILADFLLYLRDGKGKDNTRPYQTLEGLRSLFSFESYVLSIFKKFLLNRLSEEQKNREAENADNNTGSYNNIKDQHIHFLGVLISCIDQECPVREKFIFFRSLLGKLDKEQMFSNNQIAEAMGLTYGNYRQIDSRMRQEASCKLEEIQKGSQFSLDLKHQSLVDEVDRDFERLNYILRNLYEETLPNLDCYDKIEKLRKREEERNSGVRYSLKADRVRPSTRDPWKKEEYYTVLQDILRNDIEEPIVFPTHKPKQKEPYSPELVADFSIVYKKGRIWKKFTTFLQDELPEE